MEALGIKWTSDTLMYFKKNGAGKSKWVTCNKLQTDQLLHLKEMATNMVMQLELRVKKQQANEKIREERRKKREERNFMDGLFVDKEERDAALKMQDESNAVALSFEPCNIGVVPFPSKLSDWVRKNLQYRKNAATGEQHSKLSEPSKEPQRQFKCSECPMIYKSVKARGNHFRHNHKEGAVKYKCTLCEKEFKRRFLLEKHLKNKHYAGPRYPCTAEGCNITLKNSDSFKKHLKKTHNNELV